jgi:hypothetical protein
VLLQPRTELLDHDIADAVRRGIERRLGVRAFS